MDRNAPDKSAEVLDDVHKAEEEIDRFLRTNAEQAERIMARAREEAAAIRAQGELDATSEAQSARERLLAEARERAADIERQGEVAAETEAERLNGLREEVIAHILRLVRAEP